MLDGSTTEINIKYSHFSRFITKNNLCPNCIFNYKLNNNVKRKGIKKYLLILILWEKM
jgi:hypothetical protein